jgi:hypothetical protein
VVKTLTHVVLRMRRLEGAGSNHGRTDLICSLPLPHSNLGQAMHSHLLRLTQPPNIRWMGNENRRKLGKKRQVLCDAVDRESRTFGLRSLPTQSVVKGMSCHATGLSVNLPSSTFLTLGKTNPSMVRYGIIYRKYVKENTFVYK